MIMTNTGKNFRKKDLPNHYTIQQLSANVRILIANSPLSTSQNNTKKDTLYGVSFNLLFSNNQAIRFLV